MDASWKDIAVVLGAATGPLALLFNYLTNVNQGKHEKEMSLYNLRLDEQREMQNFRNKNADEAYKVQIAAYNAIRSIYETDIYPGHRFPNMEQEDANREISRNFPKIIKALKEYVEEYGAYLPAYILKDVEGAKLSAERGNAEEIQSEAERNAEFVYYASENVMALLHAHISKLRDVGMENPPNDNSEDNDEDEDDFSNKENEQCFKEWVERRKKECKETIGKVEHNLFCQAPTPQDDQKPSKK